ncbi:MAG: hypothetical protein PVI78_06530 [Anaerolineales bacterium]
MDVMREAVLIYVTVIVSVSVIACGLVTVIALVCSRFSEGKSSRLMFQSVNFMRITTAIAVVVGVFALALIDRLSGRALATLAGIGAAEFVLGGIERFALGRRIASTEG